MNSKYEKQLMKKGFKLICGVDEAGRGAFAGPLVAAAVVLNFKQRGFLKLINDSKVLSARQREVALKKIVNKSIAWSLGVVSNQIIDEKGLSYANKLALKRAQENLNIRVDYVLSDYLAGAKYDLDFELIKHGDKRVVSIAAASIIAKVFRDRMMIAFNRIYPEYGFDRHKGYGTEAHRKAISAHGACFIHRMSYEPLKSLSDGKSLK